MANSVLKLSFFLTLFIVAHYSGNVAEARGPVVSLRCQTADDCKKWGLCNDCIICECNHDTHMCGCSSGGPPDDSDDGSSLPQTNN